MGQQAAKSGDYGVNLCAGCFDKQREIDRLKEEVQRLRQKVCANQRKSAAGFFGSSTPSSQIPVKANSLAANQAKKGGAVKGHHGVSRQVFSAAEADERRVAAVAVRNCEVCECDLNRGIAHSEHLQYEVKQALWAFGKSLKITFSDFGFCNFRFISARIS